MVSQVHIDLLVGTGLLLSQPDDPRYTGGLLTGEPANALGRMLWHENLVSVQYRYPDVLDGGQSPDPLDFSPTQVTNYRFEPVPGDPHPVVVLGAIDCYRYQSCDHPGWQTSEARQYCSWLAQEVVAHMLPRPRPPGNGGARPELDTLEALATALGTEDITSGLREAARQFARHPSFGWYDAGQWHRLDRYPSEQFRHILTSLIGEHPDTSGQEAHRIDPAGLLRGLLPLRRQWESNDQSKPSLRAFGEALWDAAVSALPGWDDVPGDIHDRQIFTLSANSSKRAPQIS